MPVVESEPIEELLQHPDVPSLRVKNHTPTNPNGCHPVVLSHGLLSSSDIFDVPGVPDVSLARYLQASGFHVVTFDHRGVGQSPSAGWDFGLGEISLSDLPRVIKHTLETTNSEKVHLGGHSLGGIQIYSLLGHLGANASEASGVSSDNISSCFTIASPVQFTLSIPPWRDIIAKGAAFYDLLDPDRDGKVTREDFIRAQAALYKPYLGTLLHPKLLRPGLPLASKSKLIAAILKKLPIPSLLYDRSDFDNRVFRAILASQVVTSGPLQLLHQIKAMVDDGGKIRVSHEGDTINIPESLDPLEGLRMLTIAASGDAFVPPQDIEPIHSILPGGKSIIIERDFGIASGHSGYLFKPSLKEQLYHCISDFLSQT